MIPQLALQQTLHNSSILINLTKIINLQRNKNLKHFMIFHQWSFRIVFNFTCLFWISNRNRKGRIFGSSSTFNIYLKKSLVKLRFSCTEIFFNPLNIKIKSMLRSYKLSLKKYFILEFSPFFLLNHHFTKNNNHLCIYTFSNTNFHIILDISWNILWLISMIFTAIKKLFGKQLKLSKVRCINCLADGPPCILIILISILDI